LERESLRDKIKAVTGEPAKARSEIRDVSFGPIHMGFSMTYGLVAVPFTLAVVLSCS